MSERKFVDNPGILISSRLAMIVTPVLLAIIAWLGPAWLDGRYARQDTISEFNVRLSLVERQQQSQEQFQRDIVIRLDRMQESINTLSTSIAALAATQAQRQ